MSLLHLPPEVQIAILEHLPGRELVAATHLCKWIGAIATEITYRALSLRIDSANLSSTIQALLADNRKLGAKVFTATFNSGYENPHLVTWLPLRIFSALPNLRKIVLVNGIGQDPDDDKVFLALQRGCASLEEFLFYTNLLPGDETLPPSPVYPSNLRSISWGQDFSEQLDPHLFHLCAGSAATLQVLSLNLQAGLSGGMARGFANKLDELLCQTFSLEFPGLVELSLDIMRLTGPGQESVTRFLQRHPSLTHLSLDYGPMQRFIPESPLSQTMMGTAMLRNLSSLQTNFVNLAALITLNVESLGRLSQLFLENNCGGELGEISKFTEGVLRNVETLKCRIRTYGSGFTSPHDNTACTSLRTLCPGVKDYELHYLPQDAFITTEHLVQYFGKGFHQLERVQFVCPQIDRPAGDNNGNTDGGSSGLHNSDSCDSVGVLYPFLSGDIASWKERAAGTVEHVMERLCKDSACPHMRDFSIDYFGGFELEGRWRTGIST